MSISRTVCVALGAVVAVVAVGAAPDRAVVVVAPPAFAVAFVVEVTAPLAVVVVAAAVVVVVSPRRVCAWSLKSSSDLLPTLLSLLQAADANSASTARISTMALFIGCSRND